MCCDELFEKFRHHLEHGTSHLATPKAIASRLSLQSPNGWSAPLLLLEISGRSLLCPEISFVHCFHEMAELSDWIRQTQCADLRRMLNEWVIGLIKSIFAEAVKDRIGRTTQHNLSVVDTLDAKRMITPEVEGELDTFAAVFVNLCLERYLKDEEGNRLEIDDFHPVAAATKIAQAVISGAHDDTIIPDLRSRVADTRSSPKRHLGIPVDRRHIRDAVKASDRAAMTVEELVTEVVADIGMWCAARFTS